MNRQALVLLLGALTSSCAVGPNYKRPIVEPPAAFRGADTTSTTSIADEQWSAVFQDPVLTQLVTTALRQNFDLRIAAERVLQARAQLRITRSDQFPAVDGSAASSASRSSTVGAVPLVAGTSARTESQEVAFTLSWELDVWGRLRRLTESARAQYLATEEGRRAVVTTLIADVTDAYLRLRRFDAELDIALRTRDAGNESLRLTQVRQAGGVATGLDVRQAQQLLLTASARIASTERNRDQTENALRLLMGELPGDVPRGQSADAPRAPLAVPAGLPSALLERRPDIRQAEQALVSANAEIGAAKADFFPRISLTGTLGLQSRELSDLVSAPARIWSVGAAAIAPVFNAGRTRANVRYRESVYRGALASYQQTIYVAFREVSDALIGQRKTSQERAQQEELVRVLTESTQLSTVRYQGGLDTYLQVLDARRSLFDGELTLARLRQEELSSVVELYRALGGGWQADAPRP